MTTTTIMTNNQEERLRQLCKEYGVAFNPDHYKPGYDLPAGYIEGWIGGPEHGMKYIDGIWARHSKTTIFVGVSPQGESSS